MQRARDVRGGTGVDKGMAMGWAREEQGRDKGGTRESTGGARELQRMGHGMGGASERWEGEERWPGSSAADDEGGWVTLLLLE